MYSTQTQCNKSLERYTELFKEDFYQIGVEKGSNA